MTVKFTITRTDTIECGDLNCDDCPHRVYDKAGDHSYGQPRRCAVFGYPLDLFYQGTLDRKWNYHRCRPCRDAQKENTNG